MAEIVGAAALRSSSPVGSEQETAGAPGTGPRAWPATDAFFLFVCWGLGARRHLRSFCAHYKVLILSLKLKKIKIKNNNKEMH